MIVSWDWLKQYVQLDMTPEALAERLMMAGLNHEETHALGDDLAINLEVTSNRPDCLGHLGIAREISVLFERPLTIPAAAPREVDRRSRRSRSDGRQPPAMPALHGAGHHRRESPSQPGLAGAAAVDVGRGGDQQRGRHHQLRVVRVRPAAARLRPGEARRPQDHRASGARRRAVRGDQSQNLPARPQRVRDCRWPAGRAAWGASWGGPRPKYPIARPSY